VIATYLTSFDTSPKKAVSRNPIPALKKESDTAVFAGAGSLIRQRDRSHSNENHANANHACLANTPEIAREISASVTTTHVFWPNQRRQTARFATDLATEFQVSCNGNATPEPMGGGGQPGSPAKSRVPISSHRNFDAKGSPFSFT
jgi:hypothetical protein